MTKASPKMPNKVCQQQGKRMFKHYQQAARFLRAAQKARYIGQIELPQSMYRCEHCGHWHITTYTPESTRRIQAAKKRKKGAKR